MKHSFVSEIIIPTSSERQTLTTFVKLSPGKIIPGREEIVNYPTIRWTQYYGIYSIQAAMNINNNFDGSNLFVAPYVNSVTLGDITLTSPNGNVNSYLAKINPDGNIIFAKQPDNGNGNIAYFGVIANMRGEIYVTGAFNGTIIFDRQYTISSQYTTPFLAKFTQCGDLIWVKQSYVSGSGVYLFSQTTVNMIYLDGNDDVYVSAQIYSGSIQFDDLTTSTPNFTVIIVKYSPRGKAISLLYPNTTAGGIPFYQTASTVDCYGNVYLAAEYFGTIEIGNTILTTPISNVFIVKYDPFGNPLWISTPVNETTTVFPAAAIVDSHGNLYIAAIFQGTVTFDSQTVSSTNFSFFLLKYDSNGNVKWMKQAVSEYTLFCKNAVINQNNEVLLTGSFSTSITLGNITLTTTLPDDTFLVKYSPLGRVIWAFAFSDAYKLYDSASLTCDFFGDIYVVGVDAGNMNYISKVLDDGYPGIYGDLISDNCVAINYRKIIKKYKDLIPGMYYVKSGGSLVPFWSGNLCLYLKNYPNIKCYGVAISKCELLIQ